MMGAWWLLVLPLAWLVARVLAERTWRPPEVILSGPADAVAGYRVRRRALLAVRDPERLPLLSDVTRDPAGDPALPASREWVQANDEVLAAIRAAAELPCWQAWPPEAWERDEETRAIQRWSVLRILYRHAAAVAWADGDLVGAMSHVLEGIALSCDLSRGHNPVPGLALAGTFLDQFDVLASVADAPCRQTAADRLRAIVDRLPTPGERVLRTADYTASLLVYPGNCNTFVDFLRLPWPWRRYRLARKALEADVAALNVVGDGAFRSAMIGLRWSDLSHTLQIEVVFVRGAERRLRAALARLAPS